MSVIIYHMTLKLLLNSVFLRENAKILPYIRDVIIPSVHNVTKNSKSLVVY